MYNTLICTNHGYQPPTILVAKLPSCFAYFVSQQLGEGEPRPPAELVEAAEISNHDGVGMSNSYVHQLCAYSAYTYMIIDAMPTEYTGIYRNDINELVPQIVGSSFVLPNPGLHDLDVN